MKVTETEFAKGFIKLADDGYKQGYHERNGGNLSYRLTESDVASVADQLDLTREWRDIGTDVPSLAGSYFMVTGTGEFFRNVKEMPEKTSGLIEVDGTGTKYRIVWGFSGGGRPTSEIPTHLMNHEVVMKRSGGKLRVIYHCHPVNIIALTFILPLDDGIFSRELWESMTECPIIAPAGVGVVPWMMPGGRDIAVATSKKMEIYDAVIWAHHGIFCTGDTFDNTFGLMHMLEKSAEILLKILAVTGEKRQTIRRENFIAIEKDFHVKLNDDVLAITRE
ncbi:MAG: rhamnulose-1-phosphate aldolase [Clostridia bacterium]|nr:rhamnulose-1-phosphate aldolase [Clostridia bacterium]